MKKIIIAITALLSLGSSYAQATSLSQHTNYQLTSLNIDAQSLLLPSVFEYSSGNLEVNYLDNKLTLTVYPKAPHCPAGAFCSMMMPAPKIITVPITNISIPLCGGKIITAVEDKTLADGMKITITLFDTKGDGDVCENLHDVPVMINLDELAYERMNGPLEAHSSFNAEELY